MERNQKSSRHKADWNFCQNNMDASLFIGRRLRFKGRIAMFSVALSFLVIIIAVSVSSGFRYEIQKGLSSMTGDVLLTHPSLTYLEESAPVATDPSYLSMIEGLEQVQEVRPAVFRAGIVKAGENIFGVLVKGMPGGVREVLEVDVADSVGLAVAVPESFASVSGLKEGDRMLTYFVGEKMKVRQFNIVRTYESGADADGRFLVYADIDDMRRLNGWDDSQASMLEVMLNPAYKDEGAMEEAAQEIGFIINTYAAEDDDSLISTSAVSRYPQIFGWLSLIDFNVFFILLLMIIVAGFNMISGLLIMLFENISTIGLLKSIGMTDRAISKVFISSSAVIVAKGMLIGNALGLLFYFVQDATHLLKLDPENYFVSFVPVHLDIPQLLLAQVAAFVAIMLLLLIPTLFISKVDPAETVRVK